MNPDGNEKGKLLLEDAKTSHEIPAPKQLFRTACKNPTVRAGWTILLQICPLILDHEKTTKITEKCLSFSEEGYCQGQHRVGKTPACSTGFERDRKTVTLCSKGNLDQDLVTIFPPLLSGKFLQLLLLESLQPSSEFRYAQTCATAFMCH